MPLWILEPRHTSGPWSVMVLIHLLLLLQKYIQITNKWITISMDSHRNVQGNIVFKFVVSAVPDDGIPPHDDVIKWKHFPRYWPFVRGIHRPPVNSLQKCQWRGAWMFSLLFSWTNGWVYNRVAGDLRRHRVHDEVTVMIWHYVICEDIDDTMHIPFI